MGFDPISFLISFLIVAAIQILIALLTPKPKKSDDRSNLTIPTVEANTPRWKILGEMRVTPALILGIVRPYQTIKVDPPAS